ncbi:MAG: histidine kinase [Gammaproteobacteria bacterium]|nr:histidine kinase [Gammaproteobacteria bacterium]
MSGPGAASDRSPSMPARVSMILTLLLAMALGIALTIWLYGTRQLVYEEVTAARRVAEQWLEALVANATRDGTAAIDTVLPQLVAVGRLRANSLNVYDASGALRYRSPESTWKAGRVAPRWFAALTDPRVPSLPFALADGRIELVPDTSRAVLDAWDQLRAALGWSVALLVLVWFGTHSALRRAFAPLTAIDAALRRGADGRFDQRLPRYRFGEIDRIAASYNRLAETLDESRVRNRQLEQDQAVAQTVQARLEEERRTMAGELHDELGQAITAVRAIAGAIRQRADDRPELAQSAEAILATTRQMQDGVDAILRRLRTPGGTACEHLERMVEDYCTQWAERHPDIALGCNAAAPGRVDDMLALAVLRLLQESLTNVARHAGARRVEVRLVVAAATLELSVRDDGRGLPDVSGSARYGLLGMEERVARHGGTLRFESMAGGGLSVCARLPLRAAVGANDATNA